VKEPPRGLLLAATLAAMVPASICSAEGALTPHRFGVGLQVAPIGTPVGHLGIPFGTGAAPEHGAVELTFRWQSSAFSALTLGAGVPHSAMGLSLRAGYEIFARVGADHAETVSLELYYDPGWQVGFAGPDYFARHSHVFVDYPYAVQGPVTLATRFAAGARLSWARGRFDTYAEEIPIIALTPRVEPLFELGIGLRIRI
jgi:hypothetical protein